MTFSAFGKECILKKIKDKKIEILMAGVDKDKFKPLSEAEKDFFKHQIRIPADSIVFLAVGENTKKEGMLLLLETFKNFLIKYKNKVDNAILYLITPINNNLIKFIDSEPVLKKRVFYSGSYTGIKEEVFVKFYQLSDIFISLSRGNGTGMSINEALSCGLPVIAPNHSVNPEIVNNKNCLVKGINDIESWEGGYIKYFVPDVKNAISIMYSLYKDVKDKKIQTVSNLNDWEDVTLKLKEYLLANTNENLKFNYPEPQIICAL